MRHLLMLAMAAMLVGGCGGDEGRASKASGNVLLEKAADRSDKLKTFKGKVDLTMKEPGDKEATTVKADIVSTTDGTRSRMVGEVKTEGQTIPMEMLGFDKEQFIRSEVFAEQLPKGKEWMRQSDDTSQMPMGEFLKLLRTGKDFKNHGEETVGGRTATHFGGAVDVAQLAEAASPELAQAFSANAAADSVKMDLDVWIDKEALPVRMIVKVGAGAQDDVVNATIDFLDYDVPADFERPEDSTVFEAPAG